MTSDLTKYVGNKLVRWLAGQAMPAAPALLYMALFNGDPKSGGSEVTTTVRPSGRPSITWLVPASNDIDNFITNSATVDFGLSAGNATLTHSAIFDAPSGGKMICAKALPGQPISVVTTQSVSFGAADVAIEVGA